LLAPAGWKGTRTLYTNSGRPNGFVNYLYGDNSVYEVN